jgi:hypothetical protein
MPALSSNKKIRTEQNRTLGFEKMGIKTGPEKQREQK